MKKAITLALITSMATRGLADDWPMFGRINGAGHAKMSLPKDLSLDKLSCPVATVAAKGM